MAFSYQLATMYLDEFIEIYHEYGDVVARLRADEVVDPSLSEIMETLPEAAMFFKYTPGTWVYHLKTDGRLADQCPAWDEFSGGSWRSLLYKKPEYASRCDWSKMTGVDYRMTISEHPQLAGKLDWGILDGWDWACLLPRRPEFMQFCKWEKLDGWDWSALLSKCPQYITYRGGELFESGPASNILIAQPHLYRHVDFDTMKPEDWMCLLEHQPWFMTKCRYEVILSESELIDLMSMHAMVANYIHTWNFSVNHWIRLAQHQPHLLTHCRAWAGMNAWAVYRLFNNEEILPYVKWEELQDETWYDLICTYGMYELSEQFINLSKLKQDQVINYNPYIIDLVLATIL